MFQLPSMMIGHSKQVLTSDFCYLLITFANSFNPDMGRQNVRPDLDPNLLTFFEKGNFLVSQQTTNKTLKISQHAKSKPTTVNYLS